MRGRRPKPTALQVLHGNPSKLRKDDMAARLAVEPPDTGMDPPDDFNDTERAIWSEAVASAPPGVLRRIDTSVLVAWVVACDLHRRARIAMRSTSLLMQIQPAAGKKGEPAKAPNSYPIVSPLIHIVNRQAAIMTKCAEQLGFTPTSRSRVAAATDLPISLTPKTAQARTSPHVALEDFIANAPPAPSMH